MGLYRFTLAILVLLSHTGFTIYEYNQGVMAVISFLLISGFTMETLLDKYYKKKELIKYFYVDRALRLFPQFIFYLFMTIAIYYTLGINKSIDIYIKDINIINIVQNIFMIPLGYYMFNGLSGCQIIPPAWTLGLEVTFYIVFPFIYFKNNKILTSFISIIIFILAYSSVINTNIFGYRLLPGTLFIFIVGAIIKNNKNKKERNIVVFIWIFSIILFINLYISSKYWYPCNKEVLLGLILGIPALAYLKNKRSSKIDSLLGNLSYGIYLNHFLVMYIIGEFPKSIVARIELISISIVLAFISYKFIEEPVMKIRKSYRKKILNNNNSEKYIESMLV